MASYDAQRLRVLRDTGHLQYRQHANTFSPTFCCRCSLPLAPPRTISKIKTPIRFVNLAIDELALQVKSVERVLLVNEKSFTMNISDEHVLEIKNQRQNELDELRRKGVAKERRNKLKDFASPLTTPEQAHLFLASMRFKSRKEEWEHRPPSNLSSDGVDAWYMMQRQREQELRKRRHEAEQLLRGYRAPYKDDASVDAFGPWSPKSHKSISRMSMGDMLSDSLTDPSIPAIRRQTTMPRLQSDNSNHGNDSSVGRLDPNNSFNDNMSIGDASGRTEKTSRSSFPPERTQFLQDRRHYDGTKYDKNDVRTSFSNGRALFDHEEQIMSTPIKDGQITLSYNNPAKFIDTTESQNRLREAGGDWRNSCVSGAEKRMSYGSAPGEERNFGAGERRSYGSAPEEQSKYGYGENRSDDVVEERDAESRDNVEDNRIVRNKITRFSLESERECRDGGGVQTPQAPTQAPARPETPVSAPQAPIPETVWRDFISPEPGAKFPPESGRYHLYASYACPGSHRALIVRAIKGLEDVVSVTIVHPTWRHTNVHDRRDKHRGWIFGDPNGKPFQNTTGRGGPFPPAYPGNDPDPILNAYSIRELYEYAQDTSGKYTIPLLWDKKLNTIVNNESSDISYMLNSCFNDFSPNPGLDLYTEDDEDGLDKLNEVSQWLYPMMIHGVYRCGFAKTQNAYDRAIEELTAAFDMADELLQHQRYLTGGTLTDADIRLFVTLLRFDEVYAFYFRANTRLVMMTPALLNFCREIYQMPGVAETCQMEQIKAHFFGSHAEWNKYSVIPRGLGFVKLLELPHDRENFETT